MLFIYLIKILHMDKGMNFEWADIGLRKNIKRVSSVSVNVICMMGEDTDCTLWEANSGSQFSVQGV